LGWRVDRQSSLGIDVESVEEPGREEASVDWAACMPGDIGDFRVSQSLGDCPDRLVARSHGGRLDGGDDSQDLAEGLLVFIQCEVPSSHQDCKLRTRRPVLGHHPKKVSSGVRECDDGVTFRVACEL
jgi:hypothetical protein